LVFGNDRMPNAEHRTPNTKHQLQRIMARVLVLYNEPVLPVGHPDAESEHEILWTTDVISKILLQAGHEVTRLGASHDVASLVTGLSAQRPDVVFNLFEGTADQGNTEAYVAGLMEWLGLSFTGSPSSALWLARYKHLTKHLLRGAGLPTPEFFVVEQLPVPDCPLEWPVIVKPALQDASVGIDQKSVVTDQQSLAERVAFILERYGPPVLVERFIAGREFNLGLIENPELRVLPIGEIRFTEREGNPSYWPIVTYDAKWTPGSRDFRTTPVAFPTDLDPDLAEQLQSLARRAFRLLGCRDYGRVDFRVSRSGQPYILEVNPNPCISPLAGLANALEVAGLTHAGFIVDMVRDSLARRPEGCPVPSAVAATVAGPGEVTCREAVADDWDGLCAVIDACGSFPAEYLAAVRDAVRGSLGRQDRCTLLLEERGRVVALASFGKAPWTEGAFVLDALGVIRFGQRRGLGGRLLQAVEERVRQGKGRMLLVDLSAHAVHAPARQFLTRKGFRLVADIPDFYREGEGKLTYARYL
jgi:D-alanine-D-alanine ligase